jgi:hypothetical protein
MPEMGEEETSVRLCTCAHACLRESLQRGKAHGAQEMQWSARQKNTFRAQDSQPMHLGDTSALLDVGGGLG